MPSTKSGESARLRRASSLLALASAASLTLAAVNAPAPATAAAAAASTASTAAAAAAPATPSTRSATVPNIEDSPDERSLLLGEEPSGAAKRAPRTADGHPDFSGYWKGSPATQPVGNIGKDLPGFKLPLTAAGRAALHYNLTRTIDPEALCKIGGMPRHAASALPFEIVQNRDRIVFLYLYTYFREAWLDRHRHDPDPDPSYFGDKTVRWVGDTLVIDSVGFKGAGMWIDENANPESDAMHTVERWTRPDFNHLHLDLTVDDPKYYTRPFEYSRTWLLGRPGEGLKEYSCEENNVDRRHLGPGPGPIRRDGTRGYLVPALPANPPSPDFYEQHRGR